MKRLSLIIFILTGILFVSCGKNQEKPEGNEMEKEQSQDDIYSKRIKAFAPTRITADISHLTENQKKVIKLLTEAGHLADQIFWHQTSPCAISVRDSLKKIDDPEAKKILKLVNINYGPYDPIYDDERFVGNGPEKRPAGGNFYPIDMTKEEFNTFVDANPALKEELQSQYTVVKRDGDQLTAVAYHKEYPQIEEIAIKLEEAASYCDNESLKKYLEMRAKAIREDDYLASDMAWMDIHDNDIDVVIGPIENYEDALFNYKTAYECIVMVKDRDASKELEMFKANIDKMQQSLPMEKKYIPPTAGSGNILQIVNVVYFGGDCQKGVKTIANSLPNDPRVHKEKGGKKSMFKNMMEAKFDKIVVPISQVILAEKLQPYVNKKAFTSFVTLHEVSHTLGPRYVHGKDNVSIRRGLKELYSAIEETKADALGMYNHYVLLDLGKIDEEYLNKAMATYIAGLYRSIRFGAEEAHGRANLIQLNYLKDKGGIYKNENGKYDIDKDKFKEAIKDLANKILMIEVKGDYAGAEKIIAEYGQMTDDIKAEINSLSNVPRDLDTVYDY